MLSYNPKESINSKPVVQWRCPITNKLVLQDLPREKPSKEFMISTKT